LLQILQFPPTIKLSAMHVIAEILLRVALNIITLIQYETETHLIFIVRQPLLIDEHEVGSQHIC
jgi:hypothetical protein